MRTELLKTGSGFLYDDSKLGCRGLNKAFHCIPNSEYKSYNSDEGYGYGSGKGFGTFRGDSSVDYKQEFPFELIQFWNKR